MTKNILLTALTLLLSVSAFSQDTQKKYWVSGNARGLFYLDEFQGQAQDSSGNPLCIIYFYERFGV